MAAPRAAPAHAAPHHLGLTRPRARGDGHTRAAGLDLGLTPGQPCKGRGRGTPCAPRLSPPGSSTHVLQGGGPLLQALFNRGRGLKQARRTSRSGRRGDHLPADPTLPTGRGQGREAARCRGAVSDQGAGAGGAGTGEQPRRRGADVPAQLGRRRPLLNPCTDSELAPDLLRESSGSGRATALLESAPLLPAMPV